MCSAKSRLALTVQEAKTLLEARDRTGMKVAEAFMVRTHPQWQKALRVDRHRQDRDGPLDHRLFQLL